MGTGEPDRTQSPAERSTVNNKVVRLLDHDLGPGSIRTLVPGQDRDPSHRGGDRIPVGGCIENVVRGQDQVGLGPEEYNPLAVHRDVAGNNKPQFPTTLLVLTIPGTTRDIGIEGQIGIRIEQLDVQAMFRCGGKNRVEDGIQLQQRGPAEGPIEILGINPVVDMPFVYRFPSPCETRIGPNPVCLEVKVPGSVDCIRQDDDLFDRFGHQILPALINEKVVDPEGRIQSQPGSLHHKGDAGEIGSAIGREGKGREMLLPRSLCVDDHTLYGRQAYLFETIPFTKPHPLAATDELMIIDYENILSLIIRIHSRQPGQDHLIEIGILIDNTDRSIRV